MSNKSFSEFTKQVHILNDLILSDMICANVEDSGEFIKFSRQLLSTKYWFLRISWPNKRRYLIALLDDLRSAWALSLLLKSLWNCRPKDAVLSASQIQPWSVYDVAPLDHNRTAVPIPSLGQVMTNNRKWFHLLSSELQALALAELLLISGGPIMWEVLNRGQKIYMRHNERLLRDLLDCIVVNEKRTDAEGALETTVQNEGAKLEESLSIWNTAIKSIKESQKLEELEMTFKDGSVRKIWKVNRVKPEAIETVDFLLPSAVGKRILSYLPRANLPDCSRVNQYWAVLVEDLKVELATRLKMRADKQMLKDIMLKHDTSLETIQPSSALLWTGGSVGPGGDPSSTRKPTQSYRASEKSAGGISFRHMVMDNLNTTHTSNPKPIRRLVDLSERLYRRGAADENLWQWCRNALQYIKGRHLKQKPQEGLIIIGDTHFPCPLMKHKIQLPLSQPLSRDPAFPVAQEKLRRQFSYGPVDLKNPKAQKRYSLWSRDFSRLLKVYKVASYHYPLQN